MNQETVDDMLMSGQVTISIEDITCYILKHGNLMFNTWAEAHAALLPMLDSGMLRIVRVGDPVKDTPRMFIFENEHSHEYGVRGWVTHKEFSRGFGSGSYFGQELLKRVSL